MGKGLDPTLPFSNARIAAPTFQPPGGEANDAPSDEQCSKKGMNNACPAHKVGR
jgi:hypothetical protein